ncbi:gene transfer agent family protein [Shinella daejeonensis]|uniref:gene transfer agent family protein n=1 Tax=Shinella daejeonensis TaxID=659017 RepID=UPI0020C7780A|nr:gene transfer agent family protein [Shinella daejeonensis]MCP8894299.1 gene transfer agent family protein [Shinella daejeonensis]
MSRDASVTLDWADGTYVFRLAWAELEMLQEAVDAGPWVVLQRLVDKSCRVGDISNVIRLGLIGGGLEPVAALKLVRSYVEARPPAESLIHAFAVLSAALNGAPEEPVGEHEAANQEAENA